MKDFVYSNINEFVHWPSFAEPIFPDNIRSVSRRATREIKHTMMTSAKRARFDPWAEFAFSDLSGLYLCWFQESPPEWPVPSSVWFVVCFCSRKDSTEADFCMSFSKIGFIKSSLRDRCISNCACTSWVDRRASLYEYETYKFNQHVT